MTSDLIAAYQRHKVILWVEDDDTRVYLRAVWADDDIGFMIAGNVESVFAVVTAAHRDGANNVFGLVDRDFRQPNFAGWSAGPALVYVPETHEIECYLLDEIAVSGLPPSLNPHLRLEASVRQKAFDVARSATWWMAVRALVSEGNRDAMENFPSHPKLGLPNQQKIPDLAAAEEFVHRGFSQVWAQSINAVLEKFASEDEIRIRLTTFEAEYAATLLDDRWRTAFSGKEMFSAMATYVYLSAPGSNKRDLVLGIGQTQRRLDRVPAELLALRQSLRNRVGI